MRLKNFLIVLFITAFGVLLVACNDKVEPKIVIEADFTTVVGERTTLKPQVFGLEEYQLVYTSSAKNVIDIDQTGYAVALAAGESTITVSVKDMEDVKAEIKIKVLPKVTLNDFAPTKIELSKPEEKMALNTSMQLTVTLTPATANNTLFWESTNPAVATVVNGTVFAHNYGVTTIKAISAINKSVVGEIEVVVANTGSEGEVVDSAIAYLLSQLPEFVHETFTLPVHPNPDVQVTWKNQTGQAITEYTFNATEDSTEIIRLTVKYGNTTKNEDVELKLAVDLENNIHVKIPLVARSISDYFASLNGKVTGNLNLPTNVIGVPVQWMTTKADVIKADGTFLRPDNDTAVTLTAFVGPTGMSKLLTFPVTAVGYTADEKIDYMKTQGVLKDLVNAVVTGPVSLPSRDPRFGAEITWKSSNTEVLDDNGNYVNIDLAQDTTVTLTATVKYTVTGFAFEKEVEFVVTVKPLTDTGRAALLFLQSGFELPKQVVFGATPAYPNKLANLPTTVDGAEGVTISWFGREGEFNSDMEVLIPRISYTPTEVYARFSKEGVDDVVLAFDINIGVLTGKHEEAAFTARTGAFNGADHDKLLGLPPVEGGHSGTLYALGFEKFFFKSNFTWVLNEIEYTWDFYFFFAPGNYKEWTGDHLKEENGKKYVDASLKDAQLAAQWGSTARTFKNRTNGTIYVKLADFVTLGAQASAASYTVFVIDADGYVTTTNVSITEPGEGITEVAIPAGGMVVNPAYLDGPLLRPFGNTLGNKIDVIQIEWGNYGK